MMDYYEELGVDRGASSDEIRQAYKHLVRLLHPDHCSDQAARPLADLQMKRLNEILHVLTTPAERELYDRERCGPAPQAVLAILPGMAPHRSPPWFWLAAGGGACLVMLAMLVYAPASVPNPPAPRDQPVPAFPMGPQKAAVKRVNSGSPLSVANRPARTQLQAGIAAASGVSTPPPDNDPPPLTEPSLTPMLEPLMNTGPPSPILEPVPPTSANPRGWTGVWLLAGSSYSKISGMYPPEFIELSLAENDGILSGHYRSRYRIADQAISPVVSFQFEGRAGADRASLSWSGSGGSKGQVQLRLLPGGGLEVSWIADQVSPELQLISGTATLARKWE